MPETRKQNRNNDINDSVDKSLKDTSERVLSSEKREDIWAIIIAGIILLLSAINPDAVYTFFKKTLFMF